MNRNRIFSAIALSAAVVLLPACQALAPMAQERASQPQVADRMAVERSGS